MLLRSPSGLNQNTPEPGISMNSSGRYKKFVQGSVAYHYLLYSRTAVKESRY